jgi:hypothetical protein
MGEMAASGADMGNSSLSGLGDWTMAQLRELAKRIGLGGYSRMDKTGLFEAVSQALPNAATPAQQEQATGARAQAQQDLTWVSHARTAQPSPRPQPLSWPYAGPAPCLSTAGLWNNWKSRCCG